MKNKLRKALLARRHAQPEKARQEKGRLILKCLLRLPAFKRAKHICTYVSLPEEVDTFGLIAAAWGKGKKIAVPKTDWEKRELSLHRLCGFEELAKGKHRIHEPLLCANSVSPHEIDLFLVPGVAFDKKGCRLGFGHGFYDKLLAKARRRCPKVALAFDFQVLPVLPREGHDQEVDLILTEKRTIRVKRGKKARKVRKE